VEKPVQQFQFDYDVGEAQSAVLTYCRKQFPFFARSVRMFIVFPLLAIVAVASLLPNYWVPAIVGLVTAIGIPKSSAPMAGGLIIGGISFAMLRLTGRARKKYVAKGIRQVFPRQRVNVAVGGGEMIWTMPGFKTMHSIEAIHAIMVSESGMIVGLGSSALHIPRSAFEGAAQMVALAKLLLRKMTPDSVARSVVPTIPD
jgi:hypothetical protein